MTDEERKIALYCLKVGSDYHSEVCQECIKFHNCNQDDVTETIIKELEKEPVLDKIRAEIEEQVLESLSDGGDDWFAAEKVNECLDIIDKYKAESEQSDDEERSS